MRGVGGDIWDSAWFLGKMAQKNELVAIKNKLHSSQQKLFDSLQTCSDLVFHPKLQERQKVNVWATVSKRATEWVYLVFSNII